MASRPPGFVIANRQSVVEKWRNGHEGSWTPFVVRDGGRRAVMEYAIAGVLRLRVRRPAPRRERPAAINGQLRLQVDTEYLRIDAGTDGQPGFTDQLTQWSYRFNVVYRPLDALSLTATLPLVTKSIHTVGGGSDVTASNLTGLGDVELGGALRALDLREHRRAAGAGVRHLGGDGDPDGPPQRHRRRTGPLIDPHGQLGTGGWGPFAGRPLSVRAGRLAWRSRASRIDCGPRPRTSTRASTSSGTPCSGACTVSTGPCPPLALDLGPRRPLRQGRPGHRPGWHGDRRRRQHGWDCALRGAGGVLQRGRPARGCSCAARCPSTSAFSASRT